MDLLKGGKKQKKTDKDEAGGDEDGKQTGPTVEKGENDDDDMAMTQIKRDFLALDFKVYLNVIETLS